MTDNQSEVTTLKEVALAAYEFAKLLEDIGYKNPELVTEELRELHANAFAFWWGTLESLINTE